MFKNIHELEPTSDDESTSFESVSVANDDSLSFIEMEEEIKLYCNSHSKDQNSESDTDDSLNTSIGSSEDSAGTGAKREYNDNDESLKGSFNEITFRMRLQDFNNQTFEVQELSE